MNKIKTIWYNLASERQFNVVDIYRRGGGVVIDITTNIDFINLHLVSVVKVEHKKDFTSLRLEVADIDNFIAIYGK